MTSMGPNLNQRSMNPIRRGRCRCSPSLRVNKSLREVKWTTHDLFQYHPVHNRKPTVQPGVAHPCRIATNAFIANHKQRHVERREVPSARKT